MAVLARLFKGSKFNKNVDSKLPNTDQKDSWDTSSFKPSQIRLILFKDHDIQGRKLIFDSKAIKRIEEIKEESSKKNRSNNNTNFDLSNSNEQLNGDCSPKYQITRAGSDVKLLGEMMFGSAPITHQGTTLRVHSIRAPPQLMVTKVFIPSRTNRESSNYGEESYDNASLNSSLNDISSPQLINSSSEKSNSIAQSIPVDVPLTSRQSSKDDDSGLSLSASSHASESFHTPYPSPGSSSSINSNSFNSLHRRWMRSQTTCLEYGIRKRASYDGLENQPTTPSQRRSKIGLGIVFEVGDDIRCAKAERFQSFFFSHITLIEGHINKLKLAIENACCIRRNFMNNVMEALEIFRVGISDLYLTARFPHPVWLDMMAFSTHRYALCNKFMRELMQSIDKYDTKNTNFFLSTLLTAVLTYHLAWVPTVTPAGASETRAYHDKHTAKWLDTLAKSHPYNPLWAQLGDMYGALGFPLRLARTVVVGKNRDVVRKIIYILSYFIRCSEIHENSEEKMNLDEFYTDSLCTECGSIPRGTTPVPGALSSHSAVECESFNQNLERRYSESSQSELLVSNTSDIGSSVFDSNSSIPGHNMYMSDSGVESDDLSCGSKVKKQSEYKRSVGNSCFYQAISALCMDSDPVPMELTQSSCLRNSTTNVSKTKDHTVLEGVATKHCDVRKTVQQTEVGMNSCREVECKICPEDIAIHKVERIRNVGRSAVESSVVIPIKAQTHGSYDMPFESPCKTQDNPSRSPTKVTSQLQNGKTYFRWPSREGSNSMFDEYFSGDSEIKTIDDLKHQFDMESSTCGPQRPEFHQSLSDGSVTPTPSTFEKSLNGSEGCEQEQSEGQTYEKRKVDLLLKVPVQPTSVQVEPARCLSPSCPEEGSEGRSKNCSGNYYRSISGVNERSELSPVAESPQPGYSRQESAASTGTVTPGHCRCTTPTGRGRHVSGCSTASTNMEHDPFLDLVDLPLPRSKSLPDVGSERILSTEQSFGRSLIGDFSNHYMSDFVLHGTNDKDFQAKLSEDLNLTVQNPVLDEAVTEAVGIVADTDEWRVQVTSSLRTSSNINGKDFIPSQLVTSMVESVTNLWHLKMSPEFCLMHMEDRMQEMYFKSRMLAEYINSQKKVDMNELTAMLGFEASDLQLLFSIAGTHSPHLAYGIY